MPTRATTTPTPCDGRQEKGVAIGVYINQGQNCTQRLSRPSDMRNPGIPIQLTEKLVEIRDGSAKYPISLPGLQKSNEKSMSALIGISPDGTLVAWSFKNFPGKKKLTLINGLLTLSDDLGSDLLAGTICAESNCNAIDGMLGFKTILQTCPGEPDRIVTQICAAPKCCCEANQEEDCNNCAELNNLITP